MDKKVYMIPREIESTSGATLEEVERIFAYYNAIQYQIGRNSTAMVIGVLPIKDVQGEQQSSQYNPLQYNDVSN